MKFRCLHCLALVSVDAEAGESVACGQCENINQVPARFAPGFVIGDFAIIHEIGNGRLAKVYRAHQLTLARDVALKILSPGLAASSDAIHEFFREARAAARLNHPNIVQSYSVGEDQGCYFLVVEFIDGQDLKRLLRKEGRLPAESALNLLQQVVSALDAALKGSRLIHQNIKPENILVARDGQAKLSDIGLANTSRYRETPLPPYSSPEQLLGSPGDHRSDIYSLGIVFYELIIGLAPFQATTIDESRRQALEDPPPLAHEVVKRIPEPVGRLLDKMIAKHPDDRYRDYLTLSEDLRLARASVAQQGQRGLMRPLSKMRAPSQAEASGKSPRRNRDLSLPVQGTLAAIAVVIVLGIALMVQNGQRQTPPPKESRSATRAGEDLLLEARNAIRQPISETAAAELQSRLGTFIAAHASLAVVDDLSEVRSQLIEALVSAARLRVLPPDDNKVTSTPSTPAPPLDSDRLNPLRLRLLPSFIAYTKARDHKQLTKEIDRLSLGQTEDATWFASLKGVVLSAAEVQKLFQAAGKRFAGLRLAYADGEAVVQAPDPEGLSVTLENGNTGQRSWTGLRPHETLALLSSLRPGDTRNGSDAAAWLFCNGSFAWAASTLRDAGREDKFLAAESAGFAPMAMEALLSEAEESKDLELSRRKLWILRRGYEGFPGFDSLASRLIEIRRRLE